MSLLRVINGWNLLKKGISAGVGKDNLADNIRRLMEDRNVVYSAEFKSLERYIKLKGVKYTVRGQELCQGEFKAFENCGPADSRSQEKMNNLLRFSEEYSKERYKDGMFVILAQDDTVAYKWKTLLDSMAREAGAEKPEFRAAPYSKASIIYL